MSEYRYAILTLDEVALKQICDDKALSQLVTEQECYRIYKWANDELKRLQDRAVEAGKTMTDAEQMFPDAWENNKAIFDKFLRVYQEHRRLRETSQPQTENTGRSLLPRMLLNETH